MGPFAGLRVIDLSPHRVGAQISQLFADFGADVIQVEPPGGAEIRRHAAYPFWARGKRSIVIDISDASDRDTLRDLVRHADVLIETNQPDVLDGLGLGFADLSAINPRLIYTSVTGFGRVGPYRDAPGYEGVVLAKLGGFHAFQRMSPHAEPPFVNVPFASFAASQVAIHGILAALIERGRSGRGQWVETNLLQAFTTLDTWACFEYLIADRWPDAYTKTSPYDDLGRPASPLTFMLMIALTSDGRWLQFASVAPHLFVALMKALGLAGMFTDEYWKGMPVLEGQPEKRQELWTKMLEAARAKSIDEWQQIFDADPDVFAEQFNMTHQTTDGTDPAAMVDLISAGIANQPAAMFIPFNDPAWEGAACEATAAGIAVFAFNVPPAAEATECALATVAQNFFDVGAIIGTRLLKEVDLAAGDKILCPAEEPDQQYAIQRGGGVNSAIEAAGLECEFLRTGGDDAGALDALTTWLTANSDVKAVVPLGGTPHRNLVAAQDAAGVEAPIIGFDTSPAVIEGIKSGRIIATADQQGYIQGFQTVMQAGLYLDFALSPADINSGGNALIDQSNVGSLEDPDLQGVRY